MSDETSLDDVGTDGAAPTTKDGKGPTSVPTHEDAAGGQTKDGKGPTGMPTDTPS